MSVDETLSRGITDAELLYMVKGSPVRYEILKTILDSMLPDVLSNVLPAAETEIKLHTPVRTGQLKKELLDNLSKSTASGGFLNILLGADPKGKGGKPYAQQVNAMPTWKVRHFGQMGSTGYGGYTKPIPLNDPQAIGGYFDALIGIVQKELMNFIARKINEYFTGSGAKASVTRKLMG